MLETVNTMALVSIAGSLAALVWRLNDVIAAIQAVH